MFANMKIGLRLSLGFAIVVALMAALAVMGINGMAKIEGELDGIVKVNIYKTKLSEEIATQIHIVTRVMRTIVLLKDPAAIATENKKIAAARQKYAETLEALEKIPTSEKGKAIRAKIKTLMAEAAPLNNKVLELAAAGKVEEAVQLLMTMAA